MHQTKMAQHATWLIAHAPHVDINLIFNTQKKQKTKIQYLQISKDLHSTKEGFLKKKIGFLDFSFFSRIRRTLLKTLNLYYYCE